MTDARAAAWPEPLTRNLNVAWAGALVRELVALGADHFYVSPGYRDAPLVAAVTYIPGAVAVSCVDERAAAYRALGFAKATGRPAVLICTSGTAGANYFPAVIEASKDGIPLLVVTADRPFELVHAGANQVIPQTQLFGAFPRATFAWPEPSAHVSLAALQQHVRHAWRATLGARPGPVHVNFPFREPLEPKDAPAHAVPASWWAGELPAAAAPVLSRALPSPADALALAERLAGAERGLLVIGRLDPWRPADAVVRLAQALGWPVFADPASGVREALAPLLIPDLELPAGREAMAAYAPDVVLHVGKRLVSKFFDRWLGERAAGLYAVVSDAADMQDQTFRHDLRWDAEPDAACALILDALPMRFAPPPFPAGFAALRQALGESLGHAPFGFLSLAAALDAHLPGTWLLAGNSTAIRAVNHASAGRARIVATRGVSGIEGHVATALGLADGARQAVACLLGDVSLIHDLNSLFYVRDAKHPLLVLVANNGGGGIFHRLPLRAHPEVMSPLISTPHGQDFAAAAAWAGLPYVEARDHASLAEALTRFARHQRSLFVECRLDQRADDAAFDAFTSTRAPAGAPTLKGIEP